MVNKNAFFKKLIIFFVAILTIVIMTVVLLDPFYHYHSPWFGLKAVLTEPEYQVIGTIKNFDYDGIILGSSVAENFNNKWFEEGFNCKVVKGIKKSGTTAYLLYFLDEAYKSHDIKYVFYSLDVSALLAEYTLDLETDGMPLHIFNDNPFDDVHYIFNKDVIFEKIPYMLVQSMSSDYNEGESYNWAKYKEFSEEIARSHYEEPDCYELSEEEFNAYINNININVSELEKRVENNPDTIFYFWIPPYSSLWKEQVSLLGEEDISNMAINRAMEQLSQYKNVKFYSFLNEVEITDNLDNYMDPIHYSGDINYYIYNKLKEL